MLKIAHELKSFGDIRGVVKAIGSYFRHCILNRNNIPTTPQKSPNSVQLYGVPLGSKVWIFSGTKNNFNATKNNNSGTKNNFSVTKINFSGTKINFSPTKIIFSPTKNTDF